MPETATEMSGKKPSRHWRRKVVSAGTAVLGVFWAAIVLYVAVTEYIIGPSGRQPTISTQAPAGTGAVTSGSFGLSFSDQPRALPELQFADAEGRTLSLSDFRGRPVVLNMWATWCIPCRKEMPALDRLQTVFGKSQLVVLPLSIDRKGAPAINQFYHELGLRALGIYVDQSGKVAGELRAVGLPTTVLIDREGREVGRIIGPAEWDSPEMIAVLSKRFGVSTSERKESP